MMLVGLISDTHDRLPAIAAALDILRGRGVDAVVHPGDIIAPFAAKPIRVMVDEAGIPLYVTYGNNDGERAGLKSVLPEIQDGPLHITLDGCRILVHHFVDWCDGKDIERADVVVTGHTHEAGVDRRDGRLFVNPGECCGWVTGRCTIGVLNTESREVELCDVDPR
jgi:putative phosphoesterase